MIRARVIIVVPCYNEEQRLDTAAFRRFAEEHADVSFCFVNDGSTDGTARVLHELADSSSRFIALNLPHNSGKAEAVRRGVLHALTLRPRYVGYWDADLATPLDAIPEFIDLLERRPHLALAMGSRVQLLGRQIDRSPARHYTGRVLATLTALALGLRVYDTQCGAKMMRSDERVGNAFATPFRSRWLFDVELIVRVVGGCTSAAANALIYEMPLVSWREVPGSKVRVRDGFAALIELIHIRRQRTAARPVIVRATVCQVAK